MKKLTVFSIALAATLLTAPVLAGEYDLIKGQGVEVCEAYKKNLESFNEPKPMQCDRKINPEFTDFGEPLWEKVDLEQHRELFRRVLRYQGADRDQFGGKFDDVELDRAIKEHKERSYPFVSRTKYNLTPYGKGVSDILIYRYGACPDGPPYHASNIYLLTEAPGVQDAMIGAQSPLQKQLHSEISPNNGRDTSVGIFDYKSIPYIDKYCLSKQPGCTDKDTLIVFKYGPIPTKPKHPDDEFKVGDEFKLGFKKICEYHYFYK